MPTVVQTDRAWPDYEIERQIIEAAGYTLVTGDPVPASEAAIEALIKQHNPVAIMTCWAVVNAAAISAPEHLSIVQRVGVGLDNIAVDAATARGCWVANVPDYCIGEVSDHAIAMLLDWAREVTAFDRDVKAGQWAPANARCRRLSDLTVGIIGFGQTGQATAHRLRAFGCRVLAHTRTPQPDAMAELCDLDTLLGHSDAVIIHAPLNAQTTKLINASRLAQMKPGAFLINVSRGPIVDNAALIAALDSGHLSGAGLDVIDGEPSPPRTLVERHNVVVTPHIAFSSDASINELRAKAAKNVVRVLAGGDPLFPCNHPHQQASQ